MLTYVCIYVYCKNYNVLNENKNTKRKKKSQKRTRPMETTCARPRLAYNVYYIYCKNRAAYILVRINTCAYVII